MLYYEKEITLSLFEEVFRDYEVSEEDITAYLELVEAGEIQEAIDAFTEEYLVNPAELYQTEIAEFLMIAQQGELERSKLAKILKNVALFSFGISVLLNNNFKQLITKIVAPSIFTERNIKTRKVKQAILDATLGQFEAHISKSMMNTQVDILNNIRKMQRDMILFNQRSRIYSGSRLKKETDAFLKQIKNKFPDYQKMIEGKVLASRSFGPQDTVKHYKLQNYVEMATRTTLLNVDRTAVQIYVLNKEAARAKKKGRVAVNVVRYALVDNRPLKTGKEREICQDILSDATYRYPILALDQSTADVLGVMTVDEAMSSKDQAMGPYCRHGILPLSSSFRDELEKIIKTARG